MSNNGDSPEKFSDLLKKSWVRSAVKTGIMLTVIGLTILFLMKVLNVGNMQLFSDAKTFALRYGLMGIFLATILAGTIVPLGSPALVVAADILGVPEIPLILVATTGFTIGMVINYSLAYRFGRPYVLKRVSAEKLEELMHSWNRWGLILYTAFGLVPILPVELLSFVCGSLKTRIDIFLVLTFLPRLIVFTILAIFGEFLGQWIGAV